MFELGYYVWFDSDSTYFPIHFCAPFLDVGISRGMPHGRLPLSVTNHSLLLGRLPQAITSWSMPHGRMPLAITSQSMPHGHLLLSVSKKPEYAAWMLATFHPTVTTIQRNWDFSAQWLHDSIQSRDRNALRRPQNKRKMPLSYYLINHTQHSKNSTSYYWWSFLEKGNKLLYFVQYFLAISL